MNEQENKGLFDLGSETADDSFDPFASDDELDGDVVTDAPEQQGLTETSAPEQSKTETPVKASAAKDAKDAKAAEQSLDEKPPVFEYAGATENIDDTSKTFDELRIEKAADFPELEDGKRVSWSVEYGKITKTVADPKGASVGKMKSDIETSKEFLESLKKPRADKNPVCKVKPRVTAQSKGTKTAAAYKGVFANIDEADAAGKVISIIPAKDGNVYEIRNTEMGKFITPVKGCDLLSEVRAGFIPALPLIPTGLLMKIISFFRYFTKHGADNEALLNIYWDKTDKRFIVDAPEQIVTKASVISYVSGDYENSRYIHYMDIHSHNSMRAFFSAIDDNDEKATRLYTVIGKLYKCIPDIKTRISNGGKHWTIDPAEVFEPVGEPFPDEWKEKVRFRAPHSNLPDDVLYDDDKEDKSWLTDGDGVI